MAKIGIYVFTDFIKQRVAKKRDTFFDGQNYIGLRYIVSELSSANEISYVSKDTINSVDFVLVSLTSYYDVANLINELHGKKITSKIICGGAGYNNVDLLREIVDFGIIGRAETLVPRLLTGDYEDGIYVKEDNINLSRQLKIQPVRKFIRIPDKILGMYDEKSVGCPRKCFFCEYSWKHKYTSDGKKYDSGLGSREVLLQDIDFSNYKNKDFVTAIDGATERTRYIINKPIKNSDITDMCNKIYQNGVKDYVSLKLYCLLGYPFEKHFFPDEVLESVIRSRRNSNKRLNIVVVSPHFMPMPFTPMENEPVNWIDFRAEIEKYDFNSIPKGNINLFWPSRLASSPLSAAEATVLNRGTINDIGAIKCVLCSSKYKALKPIIKRKVLEKHFGHLLVYCDKIHPYITRSNDAKKAKEVYRKRKEEQNAK